MAEGIWWSYPFNYTWSTSNPNGITIQNDSTIEQVSAGSYTVVIDDNNSCSEKLFLKYVIDPDRISITGQVVNVACYGEERWINFYFKRNRCYTAIFTSDGYQIVILQLLFDLLQLGTTYTVNVNDANDCYSTFWICFSNF